MKSALFVDFDNVYSQLKQLQPDAAERFARQPSEWIGWLTSSLALPEPHDESARRRLLVRRCYLNPNWYQTYRHAFLRAGFEIVDCPPVTSQGKTSTDIHMVLDIIDLLQHETRCDEFIVFSADADFTPVLRKLRRYDRRTTVLAIGFPSAAYQASADLMIDEQLFIRDALGLGRAPAEVATAPLNTKLEIEDTRVVDTKVSAHDSPPKKLSVLLPRAEPVAKVVASVATPAELSSMATRIWALVDESALPVSAAHLALKLRQDQPAITENWNGAASFKGFFRSLGLARLIWVSGVGGRVLDPGRHEVDSSSQEQDVDSPWSGKAGMFAVVKEVCTLTGAPMLSPRDIKLVIKTLAEVLKTRAFEMAPVAQLICRRCLESDNCRLRQRDVTFLVRGMQLNGHVFGQGRDDETTLASRLVDQILFLCAREQKVLNEPEMSHLRAWIC